MTPRQAALSSVSVLMCVCVRDHVCLRGSSKDAIAAG